MAGQGCAAEWTPAVDRTHAWAPPVRHVPPLEQKSPRAFTLIQRVIISSNSAAVMVEEERRNHAAKPLVVPPLKLKLDDDEVVAITTALANDEPSWIHGALVSAQQANYASVCSTANGCTAGAFLSCADVAQRISDITFASYGNPTECPSPMLGSCSHPDSIKVAKAACLGKTNCSVAKRAFTDLSCAKDIASGQENVIVTAVCGPGTERRANLLRYEFTLDADAVTAVAAVSALGYHVLFCNGKRVSQRVMEPGRTSAKRVFYSRFDLAPHLRKGRNVLAASLGNGWEVNAGNQPGAIQQPPAFYLNATIYLQAPHEETGTDPVGEHGQMPVGRTLRLVSNGSWSSAAGPVTYDSVYQGERRDMRLARPGWSSTGFDASDWQPAVVTGKPDKTLSEQTRPGVVELMTLKPRSITVLNVSNDGPSRHHHDTDDSTCGDVEEDVPVMVSCPNSTIKAVLFAQYGTPVGQCAAGANHLKPGKCSRDLSSALKTACVGKESCTVECRSCGHQATESQSSQLFDTAADDAAPPPPPCLNSCSVNHHTIVPSGDPCEGTKKTVVVAVSCDISPPPPPPQKTHQAHLVDFGQNVGGVVRLKAPAHPTEGQSITVRHCEVSCLPLCPLSSV